MIVCKRCALQLFRTCPKSYARSLVCSKDRAFASPCRWVQGDSKAILKPGWDRWGPEKDVEPYKLRSKKQLLLRSEVKKLSDPYHLGNRVRQLLKDNDTETALDLTRAASRDISTVVSWNLLIAAEVRSRNMKQAYKLFNEMKKRAQFPDTFTYTTLLQGYVEISRGRENLERALSIYHSLFSPNARVQPNLIHTNIMLNLCGRHGDIDGMFGVAARLPLTGTGAPDCQTFTTILHALRNAAWQGGSKLPGESEEEKRKRYQHAIFRGKRIWEDVVARWTKGELAVDERLVCAMGRLLLIGENTDDVEDILSLVEQTMNVPRQIPRKGDPSRGHHYKAQQLDITNPFKAKPDQDDSLDAQDKGMYNNPVIEKGVSPLDLGRSKEQMTGTSAVRSPEFEPLPPSTGSRLYPRPGNDTLSLVVGACNRLWAIAEGQRYWEIITQDLEPDLENYHTYLRLLRRSRASSMALELVERMRVSGQSGGLGVGIRYKTIRLAMGACGRDSANPHCVSNATQLLRIARDTFPQADLRILDLAVTILRGQDHSAEFKPIHGLMDLAFEYFMTLRAMATWGKGKVQTNDQHVLKKWRETAADIDAEAVKFELRYDDNGRMSAKSQVKVASMGRRIFGQTQRFIGFYSNDLGSKQIHSWRDRMYSTKRWSEQILNKFDKIGQTNDSLTPDEKSDEVASSMESEVGKEGEAA